MPFLSRFLVDGDVFATDNYNAFSRSFQIALDALIVKLKENKTLAFLGV